MVTFFKRIFIFWLCISALLIPVSAQGRTHVVQRGENLYRIGLRYGCTVAQISAANGITNPNRIFVGQTLTVPTCRGTTTTNPSTPTTTTPTSSTSATALTNTDNWCYGGRPWGDGRCTPANDPALREWYWKGGWYMAQVERGALRPDQVPSEFQVLVPIAFPQFAPVTTPTSGGDSSTAGGSTGGSTACTGGAVLQLVNCARAANGLAPLSSNSQLDTAALNHANDMVTNGFFSHTGSSGSSVGDRVTATGFVWLAVGENIAAGQTSDQAVFDAWMGSTGHRANILNGSYTRMGLARLGNTWVQVFAAP